MKLSWGIEKSDVQRFKEFYETIRPMTMWKTVSKEILTKQALNFLMKFFGKK